MCWLRNHCQPLPDHIHILPSIRVSIGIFFRGVSRGRFRGRFFWQAPRILEDGIRRYFWDLTDVLRVSGMLEQTYIRESSRAGFGRQGRRIVG